MDVVGFFVPMLVIIVCYILLFVYWKKYSKAVKDNVITFSRIPKTTLVINLDKRKFSKLENTNSVTVYESFDVLQKCKNNRKFELQLAKKTLFIILGFYCWLPYAILCILSQFASEREKFITPHSTAAAVYLAKFSAVLNPIIYVFNDKSFRKQIKKFMSLSSQTNVPENV